LTIYKHPKCPLLCVYIYNSDRGVSPWASYP